MTLLKSASKIVFIIMAVAMVIFTATGIIDAERFMELCLMVFTFYFTNKGSQKDNYLNK